MSSFHELSWPTKALSAGAMLAMVLSLTGCPSTDATKGQASNGQFDATHGDPAGGDFLTYNDRIFFDYDSAELRQDGLLTLDGIGAWLSQNPNVTVRIEGHCDERGTREYNLALGERRVQAVARYLVAAGVDPIRMHTISYGKERPEVLGSDDSAWAKNRRAVFVQVN